MVTQQVTRFLLPKTAADQIFESNESKQSDKSKREQKGEEQIVKQLEQTFQRELKISSENNFVVNEDDDQEQDETKNIGISEEIKQGFRYQEPQSSSKYAEETTATSHKLRESRYETPAIYIDERFKKPEIIKNPTAKSIYSQKKVENGIERFGLFGKAKAFFADVLDVLSSDTPLCQMKNSNIFGGLHEIVMKKEHFKFFRKMISQGQKQKETQQIQESFLQNLKKYVVIRFFKPNKEFYNNLIFIWFSINPYTVKNMTQDMFLQFSQKYFKNCRCGEWRDKLFNEPVKQFFKTMKNQWGKLVDKTKNYDEVTLFVFKGSQQVFIPKLFYNVRNSLYIKWSTSVFKSVQSFRPIQRNLTGVESAKKKR